MRRLSEHDYRPTEHTPRFEDDRGRRSTKDKQRGGRRRHSDFSVRDSRRYRFVHRAAHTTPPPPDDGIGSAGRRYRREMTRVVAATAAVRPRRQLRASLLRGRAPRPCVCRVTAAKMIADPTATAKPAPPTPPWPSRSSTVAAARLSSLIALLLLLLLLDVGTASASICKAGLCTREQYCCGDGKCCDNVYSLWYLW